MAHIIPNKPFIFCLLALVVWQLASLIVVIPVHLSTILLSVCLVYVGSYISIFTKKEEQMNKKDAITFPLIASVALFGLYIAFKYFNENVVKMLIFIYLIIASCVAMAGCFNLVVENYFPLIIYDADIKWPLKLQFQIRLCDLVSYPCAFALGLGYFIYSHWFGNNVFGICLVIFSLAYESIGSFKNGCLLLSGLFLYDIFWVFGTEVMVKVATGVKGPIKFVFPKVLPAPLEYTRESFSMLGLGDVVVPGFFIAFLLAFDAYNARKEGKNTTENTDWSKPYFHTGIIFYALALLITVVVMIAFKHAQPALLYIVPACFIASFGTALYKGQLFELWNYSEEKITTKYSKKED